jgi:hypothetical protein
VQLRWNEN